MYCGPLVPYYNHRVQNESKFFNSRVWLLLVSDYSILLCQITTICSQQTIERRITLSLAEFYHPGGNRRVEITFHDQLEDSEEMKQKGGFGVQKFAKHQTNSSVNKTYNFAAGGWAIFYFLFCPKLSC